MNFCLHSAHITLCCFFVCLSVVCGSSCDGCASSSSSKISLDFTSVYPLSCLVICGKKVEVVVSSSGSSALIFSNTAFCANWLMISGSNGCLLL